MSFKKKLQDAMEQQKKVAQQKELDKQREIWAAKPWYRKVYSIMIFILNAVGFVVTIPFVMLWHLVIRYTFQWVVVGILSAILYLLYLNTLA